MGLPLKVDGQNADGTFDGFDDAPDIVQLYHSTSQMMRPMVVESRPSWR